jgi:Tfp pilus assembly protein PilF
MSRMLQKVQRLRRRLPWLAAIALNSALVVWAPIVSGQVLYLSPASQSPGSIVSVKDFKIPSKAEHEFARGLDRLKKQDAAGSLVSFDEAIQLYPDYYQAYYNEGVAQMRLGRDESAHQSYQKAIDLSEGRYIRAVFGYGLVLCREGKPEEAARVVRRGLELDPSIPDGHVVRALALLELHRLDEAESRAQEALRSPTVLESSKAYLVPADIHTERRDYPAQARDLQTYLSLAPDDPNSDFLRTLLSIEQRIAAAIAETAAQN